MTTPILAIFALTYLGMAIGRIPGLKLDRSGIALVAAVAIVVADGSNLPEAAAWVDMPTLALLFGLMVLSAQFAVSGFYDLCATRITAAKRQPGLLLAVTIVSSGVLSAVLSNDIVVFAMTPMLCMGLRARGLDPIPFLIGLAAGAN